MDQQQALADRLKQANNILVTVSNNPSVDQLAACIGLTLALNKLNKHATAVFSGTVPSTIEFLQPDKTIEKNTDSLRDFIISLDKSKADKLRYKVEDKVVKIFITPYRTSINEKDFEFSQGDFNVDVVLALGVHIQADLDQAITAHGRILHDATVATVNVKPGGELGGLNWLQPKASSLSELSLVLIDMINKNVVDNQIATAFLTGIVAETARFSNDKTTPTTMTISAELMAAGANQQLVSTKLEPPKPVPAPAPVPIPTPAATYAPTTAPVPTAAPVTQIKAEPAAAQAQPAQGPNDGTIEISHLDEKLGTTEPEKPAVPQIKIDEQGSFYNAYSTPPKELPKPVPEPQHLAQEASTDPTQNLDAPRMILTPPANGGQLTANVVPEDELEQPAGAPAMNMDNSPGILQRETAAASEPKPMSSLYPQPAPAPLPAQPPQNDDASFLAPNNIGPTVPAPAPNSDGSNPPAPAQSVDDARTAALQAISANPGMPTPIQALNAGPLGEPLRPQADNFDANPGMQRPVGSTPPPSAPPPMMPPTTL
ncbi:MAG TPA: hypothetical protein VMR45_05765 [Patescibacteria group bacterium]|nr:hypothetical protein [Patescibacteria group bacterium]